MWIIGGGGGAKAMLAPLSNYWAGGGRRMASTLSTPMQINALVRLNCVQLSSVGGDK